MTYGRECVTLRQRLSLEVIDEDTTGEVPITEVFRGPGELDYACGRCGSLLAIGVLPGMFRRLVFTCSCGASNMVPSRPVMA